MKEAMSQTAVVAEMERAALNSKLEASNTDATSVRKQLVAAETQIFAGGAEIFALKKAFEEDNRQSESKLAAKIAEIAALTD